MTDAKALVERVLLEFNPRQPRWPGGAPASHGGEWRATHGLRLTKAGLSALQRGDRVAAKVGGDMVSGKFDGRYKNGDVDVIGDDGSRHRVPSSAVHAASARQSKGTAKAKPKKAAPIPADLLDEPVAPKPKRTPKPPPPAPPPPPPPAPPPPPRGPSRGGGRTGEDIPRLVRDKTGEPTISKITRSVRRDNPTDMSDAELADALRAHAAGEVTGDVKELQGEAARRLGLSGAPAAVSQSPRAKGSGKPSAPVTPYKSFAQRQKERELARQQVSPPPPMPPTRSLSASPRAKTPPAYTSTPQPAPVRQAMTNQGVAQAHSDAPKLSNEDRTYSGYGASPTRAAPPHVRDIAAWERASEQVVNKTGLDYDDWGPKQFAAATAIYKNSIAKRGVGNSPGPNVPYGQGAA